MSTIVYKEIKLIFESFYTNLLPKWLAYLPPSSESSITMAFYSILENLVLRNVADTTIQTLEKY